MPGFPVLHYLSEFAQTHAHGLSDVIQLILCHLFSSCLQSFLASGSFPFAFNLSQHQGLSQWVSSSHQVVKIWSFSFSISPSNEYSGLTSFSIDWFYLLADQGALKSLLQHHSSKASIHCLSVLFLVEFSHPYVTTGKTIALTIRTFVGKVMILVFNTLARFVIAFLPRGKCLLISWFTVAMEFVCKNSNRNLTGGDGTKPSHQIV